MTPAITWPLVIMTLTGLALVILVVSGPAVFRRTRRLTDSFWCPVRQRFVSVEFRVDARDGRRVDVNRCSGFTPETAMRCDKSCLDPRTLRSRRAVRRTV